MGITKDDKNNHDSLPYEPFYENGHPYYCCPTCQRGALTLKRHSIMNGRSAESNFFDEVAPGPERIGDGTWHFCCLFECSDAHCKETVACFGVEDLEIEDYMGTGAVRRFRPIAFYPALPNIEETANTSLHNRDPANEEAFLKFDDNGEVCILRDHGGTIGTVEKGTALWALLHVLCAEDAEPKRPIEDVARLVDTVREAWYTGQWTNEDLSPTAHLSNSSPQGFHEIQNRRGQKPSPYAKFSVKEIRARFQALIRKFRNKERRSAWFHWTSDKVEVRFKG